MPAGATAPGQVPFLQNETFLSIGYAPLPDTLSCTTRYEEPETFPISKLRAVRFSFVVATTTSYRSGMNSVVSRANDQVLEPPVPGRTSMIPERVRPFCVTCVPVFGSMVKTEILDCWMTE